VLPLKLFLYLAAGRPIFAASSPDTAEILEHDRNAWLVPPGDVAQAESKLKLLLSDGARLERLGNACRDLAADLTWDARAAKIETFFEKCLARDAASVRPGPWSASAWARDSLKWLGRGVASGRWIYR
jgi:glycosyltransferase involved in cell wall biosynthesis